MTKAPANKSKTPLVFGVIGDPIKHSKSPLMHNAALKKLSIKAEYRAFRVATPDLAKFFARLRSGEIAGINVTIPHKQSVLPLVDALTPEARAIGAVNTVYHQKGKLVGHNTDGAGYLASLTTETKFKPKGKRVVVIGAGGASLAVCYALCTAGIKKLHIANRDAKKARALSKRLNKLFPRVIFSASTLNRIPLDALAHADLLTNTTSIGMKNIAWPTLDFLLSLPKTAIASDIVYAPTETPLLIAAHRLGLKCHYGLGMLLYQGALAFEKFTGKKAPVAVMRTVLIATK